MTTTRKHAVIGWDRYPEAPEIVDAETADDLVAERNLELYMAVMRGAGPGPERPGQWVVMESFETMEEAQRYVRGLSYEGDL
jgi:hypothetical protein